MPATAHYVSEIVKRDDRDRFLTAVFAPLPARGGVMALYAFNAEVARVRESVSENLIGQIKLQWWRDVVAAIYAGGDVPAGNPPAGNPPTGNPVVEGLASAIRGHSLSRIHFDALLDARAQDLTDESPPDVAALENYAEGTSASLTALVLEVLGVGDADSKLAGRHVGIAWALTGLLRAVLYHARANRFMLPHDLLAAENLTPHDLPEKRNAAKIAAVVEQIARRARAHLETARDFRRLIDRRALPALLPATLADHYLKGLARRSFDIFDPRHALQRPAVVRLAWNAWRGVY
ncbi:MAG: squalene/phytoene synthase family protein [Rhodospirillaceae bacterium]|nr:squalene/phytoene synthase family protein [Rhodospirillaceae bacterium]